LIFINIGGLECSGACLSEKRLADGPGTQEDLLGWVLLLLQSPVAAPPVAAPVAPPDSRAQILAASLLLEHLLHAFAQNEYHEGIRDEMT
jgi:hypothetical protein